MPYVIDVVSGTGGTTATLAHLVFDSRYDAETFCRRGNVRERKRSTLMFISREISPTEAEQRLAPSQAADRRL